MDVIARAQPVFRTTFDQPDLQLRRDLTAFEVEGWDSLTYIQLILALEKEFNIKFKTAEIVSAQNVGELMDLIDKKLT